ncbi:hypothetical protein IAG41_16910 [Sphingomonas sp. JC676]|uniref:hypothetical protein n=1 Tax=Sphingomonas sp. JC676 TaxID=2768065 RepID=UPI001657CF1A|nr:hypothetical protein [Sphingomonas sp. JC676]MBC9034071.1 hypothetical protein [Sphingomonas sp. JC676]
MRFVSLLALLTVAAPALAQEAPAQQTAAPTADQTKDDKPICRRQAVTGSNFFKRECHTKAEWTVIHARDAANAERALDQRRAGSTRGD